ncbi:MAG TPA: hypothetical protein VHB20_11655 [Verrucomicrobiae bacterium]|jgi:hypothetical protein|nr:hypothetical protein [Verrucomicrobiae bacterium]
MMTPAAMGNVVAELVRRGFAAETAGRYASLIGDTPETDAEGRLVIREDGNIIDRIGPLTEETLTGGSRGSRG